MPVLYIPALLQDLTGGQQQVELPGESVRQVIDNLEKRYPGVKERLLEGDRLRPSIAVAVDGEISPLRLRQRLLESSVVHFLPAISGGARVHPP